MLIIGRDAEISLWVEHKLDLPFGHLSPCVAFGVTVNDELLAGVVYNSYRAGDSKSEPTIEVTMASISPRWCTRRHLAGLLSYPFRQLGCRRLHAVTEATNQPARAFLCHLGFKEEAILRGAYRACDGVLHAMLREECKWLWQEEPSRGQIRTFPARCA